MTSSTLYVTSKYPFASVLRSVNVREPLPSKVVLDPKSVPTMHRDEPGIRAQPVKLGERGKAETVENFSDRIR